VRWTPQNARIIKDSLGNEFRRMPFIDSGLATLQIPRIAALATSPLPAWLWSADATRIVWSNAVGAAIFGAANAAEFGNTRFSAGDPSAVQILRLSATLPSSGQEHLARLRGFGAGIGGALMCACSRISLLDGTPAILVVATERAGPSLPLAERVRRLFADGGDAVAAFAPDGTRLHATAAALQRLNGTTSLSALGIDALAARALRDGHANGVAYLGQVPFEVAALSLGKDESRVLAITWPTQPKAAVPNAGAEPSSEPAQTAPAPEVRAPAPPSPSVAAATSAPSDELAAPHDAPVTEEVASNETEPPTALDQTAPHDAAVNQAEAPIASEPLPAFVEAAPHVAPITVTELAVSDLPSYGEADDDEEEITADAPAPLEPPPTRQGSAHDISHDVLIAERRHPLRFVWHMDADSRFVVGSDEFMELVGPRTIAACGRYWRDIAIEMNLDPDDRVARAIATQETWSGVQIFWPIDDSSDRLPVELSGLPVFDRDHVFGGYRGFGVCRDIARINQLARARRARPIGFMPPQARRPKPAASAPRNPAATPTPVTPLQPAPPSVTEKPEPATRPMTQKERPAGAPPANVVPFRTANAPDAKAPSLSPVERSAFRELAQELTTRLGSTQEGAAADSSAGDSRSEEQQAPAQAAAAAAPAAETAMADETPARVAADIPPAAPPVVTAAAQDNIAPSPQRAPLGEHVLLDRVPVGILVYRNNAPLYANRYFLEWSGYDSFEALTTAGGLNALFAEPSTDALGDSGGTQKLSIMTRRGEKLPVEGRLFTVPWDAGSALALVVTNAPTDDRQRATQLALSAAEHEIRALENEMRDLRTSFERTGRREAQNVAAAKAEFLAKVSHEIRTPLNSMIGFAEVIMAEHFGPIGNDRYREYLKDMREAGTQMVSLLNDLLDLSKIETGQLDLTFANVDLNDVTQQCVAIAQQQANRARSIIRSSLAENPLHVMADARSLRQIVLTLLSNAIKFTGPGGQVIVSTTVTDSGEAVLRVRDNGVGMREQDIDAVLYPFHQTTASPSWSSSGTGLGLPLTKALAEANRANFTIKSAPNAGTLVEITFPSVRMTGH
jgi:signal transduction histidine kinase